MLNVQAQSAAQSRPAIIRFEGVQKRYGAGKLAVDQVDLDIADGEFITFLGPSGSGKTTSLMMLAGFESPTAGRIQLLGRDITSTPPWKRDIGVVFQNYALFPHMTVLENVCFPLSIRRLSKSEQIEKARRALSMVQLEGVEDRSPAQLSGGQQQRVAIARALVFGPKIILMDEPLGALDRVLREQMQVELKRLHSKLGVTFVYVTHDQGEAITMSDRVAVFNNGKIAQIGSAEELYERPRDRFVAGFLGENNILAGRMISASKDAGLFQIGPNRLRTAGTDVALDRGCSLAIRPERISIARAQVTSDEGTRLPGRVVESIYFGDHIKCTVALEDATELMMKVPLHDASAAVTGSVLDLWIPASHCTVIEQ